MHFKICILCAGLGSRVNFYGNLHKSLLPLGNLASISHIISIFPDKTFVIALGYMASQVRSFLEFMHPNVNFEFVYVDNYDKKGSGPGHSLSLCSEHLNCPFIFTSVDTIVKKDESYLQPNYDWVGTGTPQWECKSEYCNFEENTGFYFGSQKNVFIGMAGVHNYEVFWQTLKNHNHECSEAQVMHGFMNLKPQAKSFDCWLDTGNKNSYAYAKKKIANDIVEEKHDEIIYIHNNRVVKFFVDSDKVLKRLKRGKVLEEFVPIVKQIDANMYGYDFVDGDLLSDVLDEEKMEIFIGFLDKFLVPVNRDDYFLNNCYDMHKVKLLNRIKNHPNINQLESIVKINGLAVRSIYKMLEAIDWDEICNSSIPIKFHGDLQPENIVVSEGKIILLDWRDSFGESLDVGDMYYDLAKLYHAIIVNGDIIRKKQYKVGIKDDVADVELRMRSNLLILLDKFEFWCKSKGFDWNKIVLLGILQWINISSLHKNEYSDFLYIFGKLSLEKYLQRSMYGAK